MFIKGFVSLRLSYHSYIQIFLLSHPFFIPLYHSLLSYSLIPLTPFSRSRSLRSLSKLSQFAQPIFSPALLFYHYHSYHECAIYWIYDNLTTPPPKKRKQNKTSQKQLYLLINDNHNIGTLLSKIKLKLLPLLFNIVWSYFLKTTGCKCPIFVFNFST